MAAMIEASFGSLTPVKSAWLRKAVDVEVTGSARRALRTKPRGLGDDAEAARGPVMAEHPAT